MKRNFKKIMLTILGMGISNLLLAAAPEAHTDATTFTLGINTVLASFALLLLIIITVLGSTLHAAILFYNQKRKNDAEENNYSEKIKVIVFAFLMVSTFPAFAQEALPATMSGNNILSDSEVLRWILYFVLSIEIVVVFLFAKLIRFFTGVESFQKMQQKPKRISFDITAFWTRINRLKPMDEEASLDTGHSYDGIRELNNVTPPWFIAGFLISILCAGIYLWRYHVSQSAPLQIEEYNISVAEAKIKLDEYLKTQANNVDENSVVVLSAEHIVAGQAIFAGNCVACHGANGKGAAVGPNLTDNYWLHSGGIKDIFKSIKYGWQEKGMKSWKDDFSPTQIAELASYIHSLKGSNPLGAKEAQGDLYVENIVAITDTSKK